MDASTGPLRFVLAALTAAGCSPTPVDVIRATDERATVDAAGMRGDTDGACELRFPVTASEHYQIRPQLGPRCLVAGEPTTVAGLLALEVELADVCATTGGELWRLIASEARGFEIRNVYHDLNLDVRMGVRESGTRVLLYDPHDYDNQRFSLRSRRSGVIELSPLHATEQCVSERTPEVEIWPCAADDTTQEWLLVPLSCLD